MFDVARGNQDDALLSIFQTESGVSSMNWFGGNIDLRISTIFTPFYRSKVIKEIMCDVGIEIDYVVGCIPFQNSLYALCGMQDGTGFVVSVEHPDQIVVQWKGHEVGDWMKSNM